jgi:uncharacterized protein
MLIVISSPAFKEKRKEAAVAETGGFIEEKIVYFEKPGRQNTGKTLELAQARAKARGINKIVLASTTGETALVAADLFAGAGIELVVVPHQYGFRAGQRFPEALVADMEEKGHRVYFGTMLFHTDDLYGSRVPSVLAMLLRAFCQGIKVVYEILLMATNGGCVAAGEKVVVVAGTGRGADTAVVAIAAPSSRLHELHITEIICKPLETISWPLSGAPPPPAAEIKT